MKLYTEKGGLTVEGMKLDLEVHHAVQDIFKKYLSEGCDIRDLSHIALHSIMSLEVETALDLRKKKVMRERDIVHEVGNFWVLKKKGLYFVMKAGITHSVSETTAYNDKSLAIARAEYMNKRNNALTER